VAYGYVDTHGHIERTEFRKNRISKMK
jgi:hypothetical protein